MPDAISSVRLSTPVFKSNNNVSIADFPESPQDILELGNTVKNTETEKKSFLSKYTANIAAFSAGIIGLGAALKMHRANKVLNQKAVSILESVGVKASPIKSYFKRNIENLQNIEDVLIKDKLTGVFNRRYLDEYLKKAFNRAKGNGANLHVFMFDLDRFKMVNTALGHDGGDEVLKCSADAISTIVDKYKKQGVDLLFARYGGEEFTLVVDGVPKKKAIEIAQNIRASVNRCVNLKTHAKKFARFFKNEAELLRNAGEHTLDKEQAYLLKDYEFLHDHVRNNEGFTMSSGMCSLKDFNHIVDKPNETVKLADLALERAKSTGRNQLVMAGKEELPGFIAIKNEQ